MKNPRNDQTRGPFDYSGCIHVHTTYSDGTGTFTDIIRAARRQNLDFLISTDHDTLDPLQTGSEGWHQGVLVLVGQEVSPPTSHYLAFGIKKVVSSNPDNPQAYIDEVKKQGGLGFIAHPYDRGNPYLKVKSYPWTRWDVSGFDGIEIWNYFSVGMEFGRSLPRILFGLMAPGLVRTGPRRETLAHWDRLAQERRVVGIGGLDAHAVRRKVFPGLAVTIFSYQGSFGTVQTHILPDHPFTGDDRKDCRLVLETLGQGRCYVANCLQGDPTGFRFWGVSSSGFLAMGDEAILSEPVELKASLPQSGVRWDLYRNGSLVATGTGRSLSYLALEPGAYRMEVFRQRLGRFLPWIYSNHIYLRAPQG